MFKENIGISDYVNVEVVNKATKQPVVAELPPLVPWAIEYWDKKRKKLLVFTANDGTWKQAPKENVVYVYIQRYGVRPYSNPTRPARQTLSGFDNYFFTTWRDNFYYGYWNDGEEQKVWLWKGTGEIELCGPCSLKKKNEHHIKKGIWVDEPYASRLGFGKADRTIEGYFPIPDRTLDLSRELTVCIPAHNSATTLKGCLLSLEQQKVTVPVLIYVTPGEDGTREMVDALIANNYFPALDLSCYRGTESARRGDARKALCRLVRTPYLFFLDSDVVLAANSLVPLYKMFKNNKTVGMLSIPYMTAAGHVLLGASMMRTTEALKVDWEEADHCECRNVGLQLKELGLGVASHPTLQACHMKYFGFVENVK